MAKGVQGVRVAEPNGNVAVNEAEVPKIIKLAIPADLYEEYKQLAEAQQLTVAELMVDRLRRCRTHSSIRSLYFPTSQLTQLESLLQKRPIESPDHALTLVKNLLAVPVEGFQPVPISAAQAKRLSMGAYGGMTVQDHLNRIVQGAISKAVGV